MVIEGISKSMATALGKRAQRRGLTVDAYLKRLIAEDTELERVARLKTFAELAIPFQKALGSLSDDELDALARPRLAIRRTNRTEQSGKKPK